MIKNFSRGLKLFQLNQSKNFTFTNINTLQNLSTSFRPNRDKNIYHILNLNFSDKGSKEWLDRQRKDPYVKKTKALDYRSRATFKLIEIQQKFKIIRIGQKILDLGCSPGGWSQIAAEYSKSDPKNPGIVAVDLLNMKPLQGVKFIRGDFYKQDIQDDILKHSNYQKFDLVLSDMCPEFTGTKVTDHVNLINLNNETILFIQKVLKRNGILVLKTFEGTLQKKFQDQIQILFNKINRFKPSSSRSESSELYLVCVGYLENEELKKETEKITKMSEEEIFEKNKKESIRAYKYAKLNQFTLLEDLDNMREKIQKTFKIDPETIKMDPKEEEEIKTMIEKENDKLHEELHGRAYKPIKQKNLSEFVENYEKEMKELDERLKAALGKEKVNIDEFEEFFKQDVNQEHMDQLAREKLKDSEFIEQKLEALQKQISEEEAQEMLRADSEPNELLSKYKRWEEILNQVKEEDRNERQNFDEINQDRVAESKHIYHIKIFRHATR